MLKPASPRLGSEIQTQIATVRSILLFKLLSVVLGFGNKSSDGWISFNIKSFLISCLPRLSSLSSFTLVGNHKILELQSFSYLINKRTRRESTAVPWLLFIGV